MEPCLVSTWDQAGEPVLTRLNGYYMLCDLGLWLRPIPTSSDLCHESGGQRGDERRLLRSVVAVGAMVRSDCGGPQDGEPMLREYRGRAKFPHPSSIWATGPAGALPPGSAPSCLLLVPPHRRSSRPRLLPVLR